MPYRLIALAVDSSERKCSWCRNTHSCTIGMALRKSGGAATFDSLTHVSKAVLSLLAKYWDLRRASLSGESWALPLSRRQRWSSPRSVP